MLGKKGHSYEVDVWSLGCILYTLLVGKPPFETQTLKDTYSRLVQIIILREFLCRQLVLKSTNIIFLFRIKRNEYHVPSKIGPLARNLITKLLQNDPCKRPSVTEILQVDLTARC